MRKSKFRKELLTTLVAVLLVSSSIMGCKSKDSSTPDATWLSVIEAAAISDPNSGPIEVAVKGRFGMRNQGVFFMQPIGSGDELIDTADYILIEGDNIYVERVLADCVGKNVIVTGTLYGGNPTLVRATDVNELVDIRKLVPGTCDK